MVGEFAVSKELRKHRESTSGERLVDEGFLAIEGFGRRAARKRIFTNSLVYNLRIQFADCAQPLGLSAVARIEWLAEDELPAGRIVAEIEPITHAIERA